jgi:antitoxin component HigA of HigAB toxin-antitoxin module
MLILAFVLPLELITVVFLGFDSFHLFLEKLEAEFGSAKTLSETLSREQIRAANLARKQLRT